MFDIGFWELILTAVVALVVVGPERLPKLVRVAGFWLGRLNAQIQAVKHELSSELRADDLREAIRRADELAALNEKTSDNTTHTATNPTPEHNSKDGNA